MMRVRQAQQRGPARFVSSTRRGFAARALLTGTALSAVALGAFPGPAAAIINAPPLVIPKPAVQTGGGFELKGSVDPYGLDTHYHFEYGTTTSYGTNVPVPDADAGSNEGFHSGLPDGHRPAAGHDLPLPPRGLQLCGAEYQQRRNFHDAGQLRLAAAQQSVHVGAATTKGATATLAVTVPDPGTVSASGKDLKAATATAS